MVMRPPVRRGSVVNVAGELLVAWQVSAAAIELRSVVQAVVALMILVEVRVVRVFRALLLGIVNRSSWVLLGIARASLDVAIFVFAMLQAMFVLARS